MPNYNRNEKIDKNIINAIHKLPKQMKNDRGIIITFRSKKNYQSSEEHIADSTHGLQIKDIERIPQILLKPDFKKIDSKHTDRLNYFGIKYKKYKFYRYIKIVTSKENKGKREDIITVYLTSKVK